MILKTNGLEIPEHLTESFFKKSLENGFKISNIEICQISFKMGSCGGENYCSTIYRTLINYNDENFDMKEISLIVKIINNESLSKSRFIEFFRSEVKMYEYVIPEMEKLLGISLAPKFFYSVENPNFTMVFEDLNASDYGLQDRVIGLNEEYSVNLLKKIAQFHGASMVLAKMNPDLITSFNTTMFHDPENKTNPVEITRQDIKAKLFMGNINHIANLIKDWPNYEQIPIKLEQVKKNFNEKCLKQVSLNGINVLNHGDLWVNNFLFKKNLKGSIDVKFIDLQLSYWGSLGLDLQFFFNTSVQIDILKTKRNELIKIYYNELKETLLKLNHNEIPTLTDIQLEISQREFYGFVIMEAMLPIISLDRTVSKDSTIDSFGNDEKMKKQREVVFTTDRMVNTLKFQMKRLDELGVFDQEF